MPRSRALEQVVAVDLEAVAKVRQEGTYSAAARALGVSPTRVRQRVQRYLNREWEARHPPVVPVWERRLLWTDRLPPERKRAHLDYCEAREAWIEEWCWRLRQGEEL